MNLRELKRYMVDQLSSGQDIENGSYIGMMTEKIEEANTFDELLNNIYEYGNDETDMIHEAMKKMVEPEIPDWDLATNDILDTQDELSPEGIQELKDAYSYLRWTMGKMDGYASEAIGALQTINEHSVYTDFDPDQLDADLNHVQTFVTEWQEGMRIIP